LADARINAVLMLVVAAGRGDLVKVTSLLEAWLRGKGSKVDKAHGEHGITALYPAVEYGDRARAAAMVTALLRAGARVDKTQSAGRTPLHKAAQRGHEAVVALLLSIRPRQPLQRLSAALRCPLQGGWGTWRWWHCCFKQGALVDKADSHGATPLYSAASSGHVAVVDLLLQAGVNSATNDGSTPLMFAAQEGHDAVVAALLRAGSIVDMAKGEP
jgi:ankyrin repeat protein